MQKRLRVVSKGLNIDREIVCSSLESLKAQLAGLEDLDANSIKFIKPLIKDAATFQSNAKEGAAITFKAERTKSEQALKKREEIMQKAQQKVQSQETPLTLKAAKINSLGISERPLASLDKNGSISDQFCDQYSCLLYLLRSVPELRRYCQEYNANILEGYSSEGLIIEEYLEAVSHVDGGKDSPIESPLDWGASVLIYCQEEFEIPYPIYPFAHLLSRVLSTFQASFQDHKKRPQYETLNKIRESEQQSYQSYKRLFNEGSSTPSNKIFKLFGIEVLNEIQPKQMKNSKCITYEERMEETFLMETEKQKLQNPRQHVFFLSADFSQHPPQCYSNRLLDGLTMHFESLRASLHSKQQELKKKKKTQSPVFKKQLRFNTLPQYLFVPIVRASTPQQKKKVQGSMLLPWDELSKVRLPIKEFLDLDAFCSRQMKKRLQNGEYYRQKWRRNLQVCPDHKDLKQDHSMETFYRHLDQFLLTCKQRKQETGPEETCFHSFYYDQKDSFETADYRLVGAILHKGSYFHNINLHHLKQNNIQQQQQPSDQMDFQIPREKQNYIHDCRGSFQTIVYSKDETWLKFEGADLSLTTIKELLMEDKEGEGEWTPHLLMYKQIRFPKLG